MTVANWLRNTAQHVRKGDMTGLRDSAYQLYVGCLRRAGRVYNYGTPIFEREWDLLIVLDACRPDLVASVADEYAFLDDETAMSVGSATEEWMAKNFTEKYADEMAETVYVTGNPHSSEALDHNNFRHMEEVWTHSWDEDQGTVPAEAVTEYTISAGRTFDADRYVAHYMQPHHPFFGYPELNEGIGFATSGKFDTIWEKLRHGEISREQVWEGYVNNLEYALSSIEILLQNFDSEIAIVTSDHGNMMGEFGVYGHPKYVPFRALKEVPYCRSSGRDLETHKPEKTLTNAETVEGTVRERLEDLGYV